MTICCVAIGASPASRPTHSAAPRKGQADWVADLSSPQWRVREHAAQELGQAYPKPYFAADALIKAADDPEPAVKAAAMETLGWLYRQRDSAEFSPARLNKRGKVVELLGKRIDDPQTNVRQAAMRGLEEIGPPAQGFARRLMEILADDREAAVQSFAACAYRDICPDGAADLRKLLADSSVKTQKAIIFALCISPSAEDRAAVVPYLYSKEPTLVAQALYSLSLHKFDAPSSVVDQIETLCFADDPQVRAAAVRATTHFMDNPRVAGILDKLSDDSDPKVAAAVRDVRRRIEVRVRASTRTSSKPTTRPHFHIANPKAGT